MQCRIAGLPDDERSLKSRGEIFGAFDALAESPEISGKRREVGVSQSRRRNPTRIMPLLVHADCAVHTVVEHYHDHGNVVLHCGRELLAVHQEVAVSGQRDHDPIGKLSLCQNSGRRPISHRSASRSELCAEFAEAVVAMDPYSEVAGAITNNRVSGQAVAQPSDHLAILKGAWKLSWRFRPIQIFRMSCRGIGGDNSGASDKSATAAAKGPGVA